MLKRQYMYQSEIIKSHRKLSSTKMNPSWIYTLIFEQSGTLLDNPDCAGQQIMSNPLWVFVIFVALREAVPAPRLSSPLDFTMNCHVFSSDLQCVSMTLQPFTARLAYQRVRWSTCISQCVSVPHRALGDELLSCKPLLDQSLKGLRVWPFQIIIWGGIPVEVC